MESNEETTIIIAPCISCQKSNPSTDTCPYYCERIQMTIDECYAVQNSEDKFQNQKEGSDACYAFEHVDMSWNDFNTMLELPVIENEAEQEIYDNMQ